MKKKHLLYLCYFLVICLIVSIYFAERPPQLELEEESESTPTFGETEENKIPFTVSPANSYFGTELYAAALNTDKMKEGKLQHLPVFKMESREELESFYENFGQSLSRGSVRGEFDSFESVVDRLEEDFFEENTLFVLYVTPNSGSYRYGVKELLTDKKELTLTISIHQTNRPQAVTMDLVGWLISVEVPKKDLKKIKEFDATLTRPSETRPPFSRPSESDSDE